MKKYSLFATIILIAALLAISTPVAANQKVPVGTQIRVRDASINFFADTPFHILHGWIQPSTDEAIGVFDFELAVDGVLQKTGFKMFSATSGDPDMLNRIWVFNFDEGMTGTHTFTGHWYAPCQYAVNFLEYTGPCSTPNEKVETKTATLIINFDL